MLVVAYLLAVLAVMCCGLAVMKQGFKTYMSSSEVFKVFVPHTYSGQNLKGLGLVTLGGLIFAAGFWAPFIFGR